MPPPHPHWWTGSTDRPPSQSNLCRRAVLPPLGPVPTIDIDAVARESEQGSFDGKAVVVGVVGAPNDSHRHRRACAPGRDRSRRHPGAAPTGWRRAGRPRVGRCSPPSSVSARCSSAMPPGRGLAGRTGPGCGAAVFVALASANRVLAPGPAGRARYRRGSAAPKEPLNPPSALGYTHFPTISVTMQACGPNPTRREPSPRVHHRLPVAALICALWSTASAVLWQGAWAQESPAPPTFVVEGVIFPDSGARCLPGPRTHHRGRKVFNDAHPEGTPRPRYRVSPGDRIQCTRAGS